MGTTVLHSPGRCIRSAIGARPTDPISRRRLCLQAEDLQAAGCFALVLRNMCLRVGCRAAGGSWRSLLIGIGAGDDCDASVRVTADPAFRLGSASLRFSPALIDGFFVVWRSRRLRGWGGGTRTLIPTSPANSRSTALLMARPVGH